MPKPKSKNLGTADHTQAPSNPRGGSDDYSFERGCAILSGDDAFSRSVLTLMGLRFNKAEKEDEKPTPAVANEIRTRRGTAKRGREDENLAGTSGKDGATTTGIQGALLGGEIESSAADTFERMGAGPAGVASIASQLGPIFSPAELSMIAKHVSTQGKTRSECPDVFTLLVTRGAERRAAAAQLFSDLCKQ
jgi:hypothetical protein